MGKFLDISMYEDGFDENAVDCISDAVAACAGYYNRDYYFYYSFICSLYGLLDKYGYTDSDFLERTNIFLKLLGLKMNKVDVSKLQREETIKRVQAELDAKHPVIFVVKYNALFFHSYYRDKSFALNHAMIVNGYNSDVNTFAVKDTSILRDQIKIQGNNMIFFQFALTEDMLMDIYEDSANQQIEEGNFYGKSFYYLEQVSDEHVQFEQIIATILEQFDKSEDKLVLMIKEDRYDEIYKLYILYSVRFLGCIKPIFNMFHDKSIFEDTVPEEELNAFEERFYNTRSFVLSKINLAVAMGRAVKKEKKQEYIEMIRKSNQEFIEFIKDLKVKTKNKNLQKHYISLKQYFNNQAFAENRESTTNADITGEGTYFLSSGIKRNEVWKESEFTFNYQAKENCDDNISCKGQEIKIDVKENVSCIDVLECAEYGSYQEKCEVVYEDGTRYEFTMLTSDFYRSPILDEFTFWTGTCLHRDKEKVQEHTFSSRLFAKKYEIPDGVIEKIVLPDVHNMHIFALTLY